MATFCLPPDEHAKFLAALQDGTIDPDKLANMTSGERRAFFEGIVGKDMAPEVNALLESKLLLKDQRAGMVRWAKQIAGLNEVADRDLLSRIEKLDRVLNPTDKTAFLADLARQKLGAAATADEAAHIMDLAAAARAAREASTDSLHGVSDEYLNAAAEMRAYIESLKPVTPLASISKNLLTIARNNLLMNPATPIKTTVGQIGNTAIDLITRRIALRAASGLNGDLARQAKAEGWRTYRETGLNAAAMESLDDMGRLGEGRRFDVKTGADSGNAVVRAVEAGVRKTAAVSNKVVIDWAHVAPFTKFYQSTFYDMANLMSSHLAEGDAGRAADIFRDAAKIKPETPEGAMVRMESQKQAARVTSINDTYISRLSLGVKDAINKMMPGLGDILMPIAKIPANIIWNGIENAGIGLPEGVADIFRGRAKMQSGDLTTRYQGMAQFGSGIQKIARTVGTLGASALFASQLAPTDFRTDRFGVNYVKIGGLWVNMEYISAISPALAGMMSAKQHGDQGILSAAAHYVSGAAGSLKHAPGVDELSGLVNSIANSDVTKGIQKYASNFFSSRGVPAFIRSLASGDRPIERLFFGAHGMETEDEYAAEAYGPYAARVKSMMASPSWQKQSPDYQTKSLARIRSQYATMKRNQAARAAKAAH